MAHYLASAGRDYVVLESASSAASFFGRYPRFRQLISINKPYTGGVRVHFVFFPANLVRAGRRGLCDETRLEQLAIRTLKLVSFCGPMVFHPVSHRREAVPCVRLQ
jgi:hypothetical protein